MSDTKSEVSITKIAVASAIGCAIEWYDFFLYGVVSAIVFNKLFFPAADPYVSTMLTWTTYAVGFLARPVGAIIFGHFGDRIGRKTILILTLVIMGAATFAVGLLPTYQEIGIWAPIALLFYFFVMLVVTTLRKVDLHPVNYFFLACAFFAFHLLFAYLVDRIAIEIAFAICSLVSMFLTITYLRLVAGWRFAAIESGVAQLLYLILFSYALFNEGWAGLAITCGAIVTLFAMMQLTGRVSWRERFGG